MNLIEKLTSQNLDGIIIQSPENIFYLTGFDGSFGMVLLKKSGQKILVTDGRYKNIAKELSQKNNFHFVLFDEYFSQKFASTLRGKWAAEDTISLRKFEQLKSWFSLAEFTVEKNFVETFRQTKNEDEIQKTQTAAKHIDFVLEKFLPVFEIGVDEKSAAMALETLIKFDGSFEPSFDVIVAFGENTANPHHHPGEKKLDLNMPILIDCGAKFEGYCSDMTRNFWFGDTIDAEYQNKYNELLKVQSDANKNFVSGKSVKEIAESVRKNLGADNEFFVHSLGHGTGLEIHEAPTVSKKSEAVLQTNEIVTNEPGIYFPGKFGIRIEDQLVIKEKFSTENILTKFSKKLRKI